ncbi:hypothetical protein [Hymenobacter arizonensis]|nr:hypothetical protein [Hymenobacter arizonensis]
MKTLLLPFALISSISLAHAQLLPVPGGKNPDWVLFKTEAQPYDGMALVPAPPTDAMPNAAQKGLRSIGDHHYYWDAERQLAYDWISRGDSKAPFMLVNVREQRKNFVHVFRRADVNGRPNYLPGQRNPTK